jgi:hypothetical protein
MLKGAELPHQLESTNALAFLLWVLAGTSCNSILVHVLLFSAPFLCAI